MGHDTNLYSLHTEHLVRIRNYLSSATFPKEKISNYACASQMEYIYSIVSAIHYRSKTCAILFRNDI